MADEYERTERPALDAFETLGWEVVDRTREPWADLNEVVDEIRQVPGRDTGASPRR